MVHGFVVERFRVKSMTFPGRVKPCCTCTVPCRLLIVSGYLEPGVNALVRLGNPLEGRSAATNSGPR